MKHTTEEFKKALENPPICKCGCGQKIIIRKFQKYIGIPLYINHHYFLSSEHKKIIEQKRADPNSKYNSPEYRKKIGNGGRNKKITPEFIKKCSVAKIGEKNPNYKKIPAHLPHIHKQWKEKNPESYLRHQREAGKKAFYSCPRISSQELKIQNYLKELNITFTSQYDYEKGIADFFVPPNLILFIDGDFWHGNPNRFPVNKLSMRQIKTKQKDERQRKYLINQGYIVKQLWEQDIKKMTIEQFNLFLITGGQHEKH